jgi:LuxR family maltose regulon positive regulatory protein
MGDRDGVQGNAPLTELASTTSESDKVLGGARLRVLVTKVVPPRCQGLIERPRLLAVASQLTEKRLAVIKAPAGFGKTSLLATWLPELQKADMQSLG